MDGIININKPKGFTSHDVVAKLRGMLKTKKIGHTGTLDPDATGVLPICVGRATKLSELLLAEEKEYTAEVCLGSETDTQDASGTVLKTGEVAVTEQDVREACEAFLGDSLQVPPMYSAIKQNGKKLCDLARAGVEVERKPREIHIREIEILSCALAEKKFRMRVVCSKGTYIRTLCTDIGRKLGCYAHLSELCRTRSGRFSIEDSVTIEQIAQDMECGETSFLQSADTAVSYLPALYLSAEKAKKACHGMRVRTAGMKDGVSYRVYDETGRFLSVSKAVDGLLRVQIMFTIQQGEG